MKILMFFSVALIVASIWLFIFGNWKIGLFVLAIDFIISWIGGYILMQQDKK